VGAVCIRMPWLKPNQIETVKKKFPLAEASGNPLEIGTYFTMNFSVVTKPPEIFTVTV
jgi:hypothetical protein